jgi:hypothetical protein
MSGKAYGGRAADIGLAVGALPGIQEIIDPTDPSAQTLNDRNS